MGTAVRPAEGHYRREAGCAGRYGVCRAARGWARACVQRGRRPVAPLTFRRRTCRWVTHRPRCPWSRPLRRSTPRPSSRIRPTAISHANRPPRPLGDHDVRIVLRTKHVPRGVSWRGAQSEPERCLLGPEAPSCTTLVWLYVTPAHALRDTHHASNYLTIAEGPGRVGSMVELTTGHVDVPATHIDQPATGLCDR